MENYTIFIVEDDAWYGEILEYHLSLNPDYVICRFSNATDCLKNLHRKPDLVTIDYSLPDMQGGELFKKIKEFNPEIPAIIISSQENIATAVELLKAGATDYIVKDENAKDILWNTIIRLRETRFLKTEVNKLRSELGQKYSFETSIRGASASIHKYFP